MQGPHTPRSDLADSEPRMRRLLNLEGVLDLDWSENIQPVVLLDDGTLPGMGRRLRGFTIPLPGTGGAGSGYWVKFNADFILDRVSLLFGLAGTYELRYLGPNDADPVAINTNCAQLIDRAATSAEVPPIQRSAAVAAGGATAWSTGGLTLPPNQMFRIDLTWFMVSGSKLWCGGTQNTVAVFQGRTAQLD